MLTGIGTARGGGDAVDLLLDCHARIRSFLGVAGRLAAARGAPPQEVAAAAEGVRRYFAEALPLHARDEEDSILPRLRGAGPDVDAALDAMHAEHLAHEAPLATLLEACEVVAAAPERLDEVRGPLREATAELSRLFEEHLAREEAVLFPALRRALAPEVLGRIADEMRARRRPP